MFSSLLAVELVRHIHDVVGIRESICEVGLHGDLRQHLVCLLCLQYLVVAMVDRQYLEALSLRLADAVEAIDELDDRVDVIAKLQ